MRIVRDFSACPAEMRGAVVALGNFDGVHLGHRSILHHAIATAKAWRVPSAVMTFEPHPREFFTRKNGSQEGKSLRLASFHQKVSLFEEAGIECLFLVRFNAAFAALSPMVFVQQVLCRELAARHVVTGYNFAFGKDRQGTTGFLEQQAKALGFGFSACPAVNDAAGTSISSSAIRQQLAEGNVRRAAALLGRPYVIAGRVQRGQQNGRKLGFPTANIPMKHLFRPRYGVYAVRFQVAGEDNWRDGVANLGIRPTFGQTEPWLEVHGFGGGQEWYGQPISVELVDFLRDEKRFDTIEALKLQIEVDCAEAKRVLQGHSMEINHA